MIKKKITFGLIAPSGPLKNYDIFEIKKSICSFGFDVKVFESCYSSFKGYLSGDDDLRLNDLHEAFLDKEVDVILCVRGGYGAMRILDKIDFDIIKNNKKIFVGFSDITCFLNSFYQKANLITYHGIMAKDFLNLDKFSFDCFFDCITKNNIEIVNNEFIDMKSFGGGKAFGKLVGGNLSLICATLGTDFEIDTKDKILFIEEVGESMYKVDRLLTQLVLAKKFDDCSGIIFGDFCDCKKVSADDFSLSELIFDKIKKFNKPCVYNLKSGHCVPNVTLPIGANAFLDCDDLKITLCK